MASLSESCFGRFSWIASMFTLNEVSMRGELEELGDDDLRAGVAFQLDLDAGFLVGEVAHAGDAGEGLLVDQLGDAFLERRRGSRRRAPRG